jgi:hypothetical protein
LQMVSVSMPFLLAIGYLIGIVLIVLGYRETEDPAKRTRLLRMGFLIIGIMIPITPISWYAYWIISTGLILVLIDYVIIAMALIVGLILIYWGFNTYTNEL